MKKQFKKCKGFNATCCHICKRMDKECKETLVKELSVDPDGREHCIHYVYNKGSISRK